MVLLASEGNYFEDAKREALFPLVKGGPIACSLSCIFRPYLCEGLAGFHKYFSPLVRKASGQKQEHSSTAEELLLGTPA